MGSGGGEWHLIVGIIVAVLGGVLILQSPHIGLSLTVTSVLTVQLLPRLPFISSASVLLGGATFGAYILHHRWDKRKIHPPLFQMNAVLLFSILFVVWVFISNPASATGMTSDRNWMFTFVQLFILLWLTGRLLTTPQEHQIFMALFALVAVYAASIAVQGSLAGETINDSRNSGIIGANQGARYLTIGFIFLYYIRSSSTSQLVSLLALVGMILAGVGIFSTLSRTGALLFVVAFALLLLSESFITRRIKAVLMLVLFISVFLIFLPPQFIDSIQERAEHQAQEGETRYGLWTAGMDMFQQNPINGVGIGQFKNEIREYGQYYLPAHQLKSIGAHNMYMSVLAETGAVGFSLFMLMLLSALSTYWKTLRSGSEEQKSIAMVWMIALIVMMLGGLTKHDEYEKLLWVTIGASLCFHYSPQINTVPAEVKKHVSYLLNSHQSVEKV